jgi:hypothetical protein
MAQSVICNVFRNERLFKKNETILEALEKRDHGNREDWRCCRCSNRVSPHQEAWDGSDEAHFEHLHWIWDCELRDKQWDANRLERRLAKHKTHTVASARRVMRQLNVKLAQNNMFFPGFIERVHARKMTMYEFFESLNDIDGLLVSVRT